MRKTIGLTGVFMFLALASGYLSACGTENSSDGTPTSDTASTQPPATATYTITGTVSLAGAGLQGVTMTLQTSTSSTVLTDASGNYSFTGLTNGGYTLTPSKTGFAFNPWAIGLTVDNGDIGLTVDGLTVDNASLAAVDFLATNEWSTEGASWGVAVDTAGDVYVSEFFNMTIAKFTSTGTFITRWGGGGSGDGQLNFPKYIAVDGSNNVYVPDYPNSRIEIFDSSGTYITQWGSYGTGNGQFNAPIGIAVDVTNGWVYVNDTGNSRVQKFDLSGNYIAQWGSAGTGNGQFEFGGLDEGQGPEGGIAVDSTGAVYVVDNGNHRIQKFSSSGTYIAQWGSNGSGDGQFLYPSGIAIDRADTVYVVDNSTDGDTSGVGRIEAFDSSGEFKSQIVLVDINGTQAGAIGVATDSAGTLYVAQGNSLYKYFP